MTNALIIGGGIAGMVTAMALQKAGIPAVVYEASPVGADDAGAFLVVFANGLEALRTIDVHQSVWDHSFAAERVTLVSDTGKRLGSRPIAGAGNGGVAPRTLGRATLRRVLRDEAARRGIRVEHGKRFVAAHTSPEGRIVASFADGGRAQGDLLIGADGVHSMTRKIIDAAAPRPRYTGRHTVCGHTRAVDASLDPDSYTMFYGKRGFFGCVPAPDGEVWWFANTPGLELSKAQVAATTPEEWRTRVAAQFADDDTPVADIVRAAEDTVVGGNAYEIDPIPVWSNEAMLIIGDAAHITAQGTAQGVSMAIEDGVVLATCLRDLPLRPALAAYERLRRARVERVMAVSAAMSRQTLSGPVKRLLRDALLPRRLDRGQTGAGAWLTDYRVDWQATVSR